MIRFALAAILACHFITAGLSQPAFAVEDRAIPFSNEDPEMNAAIAKARTTLPLFWSKFANPGPGENRFALKVRIEDGSNGEHFWVIDIERKGDAIFGTINNEPEQVKTVVNGQRIKIDPAQITDWMYMHNGKIVGNETIRPSLSRMPKRQADAFRAMLETP
jgi:uncharacterized protein YegJ (DUF2314 family)